MTTRVAIVEDNAGLQQTLCDWLDETEELVLAGAYESGESALKDLPAAKPDVVLMDINLPGMDGVECVRQLKQKLPACQFMMLTVYADAQRIFAALESGATGYLLKRASRNQLLQAIADIRAGGSPMSAEIARKVVQSFQKPAPKQAGELSPREGDILRMLSEGLLYKEIAEQYGCSVYTVNEHVRRIYEKLHVHSRSQAVAKYHKRGKQGSVGGLPITSSS